MGFNDVANRMFALYGDGNFDDALALVEGALSEYPDRANDLIFWQACLLGVTGKPEQGLSRLRQGFEQGEWWPPGQLADKDLDSLRELPGWSEIEQQCAEITAEKMRDRPGPIVRVGTSGGTLITVQGAHAIQDEVAAAWQAAAPEWTVVTPAGMEPSPSRGWGWPMSLEDAARSVIEAVAGLDLRPPLVMTGFSIGSAIACQVIRSNELAFSGLVVVAPASPSGFEELRSVAHQYPTLILCGDQDPRIDHYMALRDDLASTDSAEVQVIEGLGHANPDDLAARTQGFFAAFSNRRP